MTGRPVRQADFEVKGNILAKKFDVVDVRGGGETVIARICKEGRFSGMAAFVKASVSESDTYFIEAQPGADLAFLTALCMSVDEIFQDVQQQDD